MGKGNVVRVFVCKIVRCLILSPGLHLSLPFGKFLLHLVGLCEQPLQLQLWGLGERQSVTEINNALGMTLPLSPLICLTQGKL